MSGIREERLVGSFPETLELGSTLDADADATFKDPDSGLSAGRAAFSGEHEYREVHGESGIDKTQIACVQEDQHIEPAKAPIIPPVKAVQPAPVGPKPVPVAAPAAEA
ncbi:hypothetical protein HDU93_008406 [Gonapodya sp. JEL0774]|nr:hypothetical protein HDU93_008406 [Gonapodya sp. JEL0774]